MLRRKIGDANFVAPYQAHHCKGIFLEIWVFERALLHVSINGDSKQNPDMTNETKPRQGDLSFFDIFSDLTCIVCELPDELVASQLLCLNTAAVR